MADGRAISKQSITKLNNKRRCMKSLQYSTANLIPIALWCATVAPAANYLRGKIDETRRPAASSLAISAAPSAECRRCGSSRARPACRCGRWLRILCVSPVGRGRDDFQLLARLKLVVEVGKVEDFFAGQADRLPGDAGGELQRQDAHHRRGCCGGCARSSRRSRRGRQQERALGGPVAAGAAAVFGAGQDDRAACLRLCISSPRRRSTSTSPSGRWRVTPPSVPGASRLRMRMLANVPRVITRSLPRRAP